MDTILKVLYTPFQAFRELKSRQNFPWMGLIVLLIIVLVNNILMIPVTTKVLELTYSTMNLPISEEQIEYTMQFMYKIRYLQVAGGVFSYLFILAIYTLIVWIFTRIAKQTIAFQKTFELIVHCCMALAIGSLVNCFLLYGAGIETIENMYEISLIGPNAFTSVDSVGIYLYTFLMSLTPFYVWFVALLTVGLAILADMKYLKAFVISLLFWIVIVAYSLGSVFFANSVLHRQGLA